MLATPIAERGSAANMEMLDKMLAKAKIMEETKEAAPAEDCSTTNPASTGRGSNSRSSDDEASYFSASSAESANSRQVSG